MQRIFISIRFSDIDAQQSDLLTAMLSDIGFHGFEETERSLTAYIDSTLFDEERLMDISGSLGLSWEKSTIPEKNWNALWESSFEPVVIPDRVAVRASFHEPVPGVQHEIVITPKMSFGTGHHATTWMMMDMMFDLQLQGRSVLDFGSGTGILAILAEKLGATPVLAIDFDPWCIENAHENLALNESRHIEVEMSDKLPVGQSFEVVLANINKLFLLENSQALVGLVRKGGSLLLSGLLAEDLEDILAAYQPLAGQPTISLERNNWIGLTFSL